jgi:hypothetical protein
MNKRLNQTETYSLRYQKYTRFIGVVESEKPYDLVILFMSGNVVLRSESLAT